MAITIKKKMTVKTIKAQGLLPDDEHDDLAAAAEAPPVPMAPQRVGRPRVDGKVYTFSVVIAIIAILIFIGLVTIQALELSFYYQPRPVFLRRDAPIGGAPMPQPRTPPAADTE